ncbi:MAG TPA: DUF3857 domain-containing protein, partial [Mucilaginibacter sp.]|nr:DUF3857 domain-containing protein [Mucilaginibacter sp.]
GKVSQADLDLKKCDFEPDANAEVLFDKAEVSLEYESQNVRATDNMTVRANVPVITTERHIRIKIFNDFGKGFGNISIRFYSYMGDMVVNDLQAETINVENGKVEITPLDKKQIYTEQTNRRYSTLKFSFPNIKPGSVIEYKYRMKTGGLSTWYFQNYIPERYSELRLSVPSYYEFRSIPHVSQAFVKSTGDGADAYQVRAMANIHSMPLEPYMSSRDENLQRIEYIAINKTMNTWSKIGEQLMKYNDFGYDLDRNLAEEALIVQKAKGMASDEAKIAYIFEQVKNNMKWNDGTEFYTLDGTVKAWNKKVGNSAEINMILFHLLKSAGVKAMPLVVSTRDNGKINPANAVIYHFNNTVVLVPVDSAKIYVLDATNKHNLYTTMPESILNTYGLSIDTHDALSVNYSDKLKAYNMVLVADEEPAMQSVFMNAEIKPDGKLEGNAEITSTKYNKVHALRLYETKGEEKYLDTFKNFDNNLKIVSYKRENADVDSLPLVQKVDFSLALTGSDENYIYLNTPFFNLFGKNPFLSETRYSDVDFGYLNNYSIYSVYKLPAGFKTDALPKTLTIVAPDKSIIFKRTVAEDSGTLMIKYVIIRNKSIYFKEDYPDLREFYKKMYEMLNEQVVLKKA